ncbi:MAG TPA: hemolysin family protein [Candidatus Marinimicrobia bacterium]|jgi:CBS domain containing-hemolysin-like protein|nr:hemolysin family protein [Candidatus Neomarinimicrobiota bacterium]HJM84581.1 hemolysin family protein [Candidatus Neomarinimicrobiota bacterium]
MLDLNLALLGLILSIIYSSAEIALLSANALQLDVWEKQEKYLARLASSILDRKPEYLSVILIGTNLSNILATSFATVYLLRSNLLPHQLIIIPIAIIILLFGEILPKSIMQRYANLGLIILSPILKSSYFLFFPIIFLLRQTRWMNVTERFSKTAEELEEKRDDIQHAYEQVDDPEAMEDDQKEMISNVFDFRESKVNEVMTPRTDISAISSTESLEKVLHTFIDSGHSKLPVFEKDLDNIIGVVYLYDLFHSPENIQEVIKPVLFIPYTKPIIDLLGEFQSAHHAMAVVLDEHGGSAGIITAEDVFEELFGDFEDEFDVDTKKSEKQADGSIVVDARMDWEDFNDEYGNMIPKGDYETVGGYIISQLGRIPNKGEHLFIPIGQTVVIKASARQIHQVQIYPSE